MRQKSALLHLITGSMVKHCNHVKLIRKLSH